MQLPENYGYVKINQWEISRFPQIVKWKFRFYGLENIFQVSYQYYSIIGVLSNIIVSIIWQYCFGGSNNEIPSNWNIRNSGSSSNCEDVPNELLSPMVRSKSQPVEPKNEAEQNLMDKQATDAV